MRKYFLLTGLLCAFSPLTQATVLLTLTPTGGAVAGLPGGLTGWGFTLSNDANYAVVNSASMVGSDSLGKFQDFISLPANFTVIGPDGPFAQSSWTQTFDAIAQTGLGSFQIASAAMPGDAIAAAVQVSYDLFSRSPFDLAFNPDTDSLSTGNVVVAEVSVSVDAPSDVPEPGTLLLLGAGLLGIGLLPRTRTSNAVSLCYKKWHARQFGS